MALVDYSDSDSDSETVTQPATAPAPTATSNATAKKPIQKVVDRSNPRKIRVNLSGAPETTGSKPETNPDEPPAKRARTGGGVFAGFASLLPPPKNPSKSAAATATSSGNSDGKRPPPRVGFNLKTGVAPAFSRSTGADDDEGLDGDGESAFKQPSIPEGQKPAEEVKLVGKPLMFRPLSVSKKPASKKKNVPAGGGTPKAAASASPASTAPSIPESKVKEALPKKKVSLFSISNEEEEDDASKTTPNNNGTYEPLFSEYADTPNDFAAYDTQYSSAFSQLPSSTTTNPPNPTSSTTLEDIASDLHLSASARRELFGRSGAPAPTQSATRVINFNTDQEYAHNEALRASGETVAHNPVRAIQPGKHSLRQLINQVHTQRDALEESFAKGRSNQNEARSRYGWK